ncbi:MAG: hypothetical protein LBQ09_09575, partial [Acidobacteriaceae bacterium]|nr:hypothetical protein [Acidobacteriaceae bacterium]
STNVAPAALPPSAPRVTRAAENDRNADRRRSKPEMTRPEPRANNRMSTAETTVADVQTPAPAPELPSAPVVAEPVPAALPRMPEPPIKTFAELVVPGDSVIGLRIETSLSSEQARVEDRIEARVVRDVHVAGDVAIPAGSRVVGTVVVVERGGKFKESARLGIRFQSLVTPDGEEHAISTDTIFRYGEAPGNGAAAKIGGGAVAGAILGAIIGGGKGAAIGASTGAGAGTAVAANGDRSTATFSAGSEITARILAPVTITVERE